MTTTVAVTERNGAVRFSVRVVPRASQSRIEGTVGTALRIRLAAPPVDGAANEELIDFLATTLGVRKSRVRIVSGAAARSKVVEVDGIAADELSKKLSKREAGKRDAVGG